MRMDQYMNPEMYADIKSFMSVDLPPVKIKQNTYQGIRTVIYSIDKWQSNS